MLRIITGKEPLYGAKIIDVWLLTYLKENDPLYEGWGGMKKKQQNK